MADVSEQKLFFYHSVMKGQVLFPGMEQKIGRLQYGELCKAVLDIEEVIGLLKEDQGFNGG